MTKRARVFSLGIMLSFSAFGSSIVISANGINKMKVSSLSFGEGKMIPSHHTCDGEDISPQISWQCVPEGTKSFALICDDPDAPMGTWVHWVMFNIPANARELSEGVPALEKLADGSRHGRNDFRKIGYGGPCPPGGTHRYFFKVYALDARLDLLPGASKPELIKAMNGRILGEGHLIGIYTR